MRPAYGPFGREAMRLSVNIGHIVYHSYDPRRAFNNSDVRDSNIRFESTKVVLWDRATIAGTDDNKWNTEYGRK